MGTESLKLRKHFWTRKTLSDEEVIRNKSDIVDEENNSVNVNLGT